jgi:hypothetical protein
MLGAGCFTHLIIVCFQYSKCFLLPSLLIDEPFVIPAFLERLVIAAGRTEIAENPWLQSGKIIRHPF